MISSGDSGVSIDEIESLEAKLEQHKDLRQRMVLLDRLAGYFVFTNVGKAQKLLSEQERLLKYYPNQDFQLNFYIYVSLVENQVYNFQLAETHITHAIKILEEMGTVAQQIDAYTDFAGICINLGKMDAATLALNKASKLEKAFPNEQLEARIICREGFLKLHYGDFDKAIELILIAEKKINKLTNLELKDNYFLTLIYSGLGNVYQDNNEPQKSVYAYLRVLEICESTGMRTRLSWHYLNVGHSFIALGQYTKAEDYLQNAIKITDDISQSARAGAYANLGYCYFRKRQYVEAMNLYKKAEGLYKEKQEDDYSNLFAIERWKAELYQEIDKSKQARKHLIKAFEYAKAKDDAKMLSIILKDIANYFSSIGDFKNAYEYQKLHSRAAEQYFEEVGSRKVVELQIKYDAEKKKQEAELLRLQSTKLQLKALRAQMNPHFMYNSLNSIQNYIMSNQADSAAKFLARFAKLMRRSLDYSDMESITLESEIGFLEDYLHINQKLRFDDLQYEIFVHDDIEEDIFGVPTMIVQPYVENAIEHGLRTKKNGLVTIAFSLFDEDTILCVIEDNGIGREQARELQKLDQTFRDHRSLGTSITEKRLELLEKFHEHDHLSIETIDLKDEEGVGAGTRVEIRIPVVELKIK